MGKPLSQVKKYSEEPKWEDEAEWVEWPDGKQVLVRVVGTVTVLAQHWIDTMSGKRFPVYCPKFDGDDERYVDHRYCPMHDDFAERSNKIIVGNCIVRHLQERGDPNPVRGFKLPHSVNEDLLNIMEIIGSDPADPDGGVDLAIRYNKAAAGARRYGIQRGNASPLTAAERQYTYYDFDVICPNYSDPDQADAQARKVKTAMARNKMYVVQEQQIPPNATNPFNYFRGDVNGAKFTDYPELVQYKNEKLGSERYTVTNRSAVPSVGAAPRGPVVTGASTSSTTPSFTPTTPAATPAPVSEQAQLDALFTPTPAVAATPVNAPSIPTIQHEQYGEVPECFGKFDGTDKCKACTARGKCVPNSEVDL